MAHPRYWTKDKLQQLKSLYDSGLSMREVALAMETTIGSINHIMRRSNIVRRAENGTRKIQFLRSPLSFNEKATLNPQEEKLKIAGLMLYWAEGAKRNSHGIDFANSDPEMIAVFVHFLRTIYQVNEKRLRIYLYAYPTFSINKLINFWSDRTKIPKEQFSKPYIRTNGGHVHDKMPHGLVHIRYSDIRLFNRMMTDIELIKSWDGRVDKYTTL